MTIDTCPAPAGGQTDQKQIETELIVFDFDETVVDCNSDTFINQLAPEGKIPEEIWNRFLDERDWTAYMQQVFTYLHQHGIQKSQYDRCLESMPFVEGMKELFEFIRSHQTHSSARRIEAIIISDANSFFIGHYLKSVGMDTIFRQIFTNPARFDNDGSLHIERYHVQDFCKLSAVNMCKGYVLKEFIRQRASEGVHYSRVNYAGDGQNDYCPALTLRPGDRVFPRSEYKLHQCIKSSTAIKADVYPFTNAHDIRRVLSQHDK